MQQNFKKYMLQMIPWTVLKDRSQSGEIFLNRLPGANQVFLGSWTVDIHQEGHSQRSAILHVAISYIYLALAGRFFTTSTTWEAQASLGNSTKCTKKKLYLFFPNYFKSEVILWSHHHSDTKPYKERKKVKSLSRVWLFVIPWTEAYQAPPSTEFSRQEYWSGLSFPSPGDLPNPGIEPKS